MKDQEIDYVVPLAITEELGRFEEFFSEVVYPAWPLALAMVVIGGAALAYLTVRLGWHEFAWRNRIITGPLAAIGIVIFGFAGYYTVSPIFQRETVCEASPVPGSGSGSEDCDGVAVAASSSPTVSRGGEPTVAPTPSSSAAPEFEPRVVLQGEISGADDFHFGEGMAFIIETEPGRYILRFEDFSVRNGPDLFVYVSPDPGGYDDSAINLGELKGTDGAFNYDIPAGTSLAEIRSAVVWCRQFAVLFATAPLA